MRLLSTIFMVAFPTFPLLLLLLLVFLLANAVENVAPNGNNALKIPLPQFWSTLRSCFSHSKQLLFTTCSILVRPIGDAIHRLPELGPEDGKESKSWEGIISGTESSDEEEAPVTMDNGRGKTRESPNSNQKGILLDLLDNHFELPKLFLDKIEASKCGRRSDLVEPKVICKEIVESGEMLERGMAAMGRLAADEVEKEEEREAAVMVYPEMVEKLLDWLDRVQMEKEEKGGLAEKLANLFCHKVTEKTQEALRQIVHECGGGKGGKGGRRHGAKGGRKAKHANGGGAHKSPSRTGAAGHQGR